tara:strand:+ start:669 stop:1301 length:633 start_codon:yes stop_codon:yes gene_type:complete
MAKNDNSFLGSIFKGAIDLTAGTIKFAYDAAEEITKAGYKAATSDSAKKIYKSTGKTIGGLFRFSPPKEKLTKLNLVNYLTKEDDHIKDTYNSLLTNHLKKKYDNNESFLKFRNHWRAICTQMIFGALAKSSPNEYFEMKDYLEKYLNKTDEEIIILVNTRYNPAYSGVGPDVVSVLNDECFNNELSQEAQDEFNVGFTLMHKTFIEGFK